MINTAPKRSPIRRFLPYYRPYLNWLALDLLCALLTTGCALAFPLIVREITDRSINDMSSITLQLLMTFGGIYLGLMIVEALAAYYMQAQGHIMAAKIETDMRRDMFGHLQQLSFSYFSNTKVGQIMSRITTDLFDVTEFAHHGPEELTIAGVKIVASFVILMTVSVPLTLIIFALLPVILLLTVHFNKRLRAAFRAYRHQVGEINSQTEDALLGIRVVQSFANEELEEEKFSRGNNTFLFVKAKQYRTMAAFSASSGFLNGLMNVTVVIVGAWFLSRGRISTGDYASYLLYVNMLLVSIRQLVHFTEIFQRGITGVERFFSIMDAPLDIRDNTNAKALGTVKGEIKFDNVSFSYNDADGRNVLSDMTLTVSAGQNVALVGPSGSGKTTLCNLIPRFYDVTRGRIFIDGEDIKNIALHSLRSNIGTVQQDVYLFSGSVLENIAYGRPGASQEDVIAASKKAGAHDFISALPEGYDTYVGERGVKLSGGQKQRISIARVFLKNPPILLLDEATSALDNESERLVQESLEGLARGRTTLTIAHRLTTIRGADVIWVLTEKGLEEHGTHEELMEKQGVYHHLYEMYQGNRTME
ncbi:MAG: ABC transporter ATP-binding protein [Eubacteriales bacterium]|jgi:ATP-binding cassette subfamily B protein|nr:ABC transporter ATP-binding protein [Eubacteriales bacterium]MDD4104467.1 ABC transporter ATP-binding protein [Eubacteriales bacterium]MDD4709829.1 ABC transporter ATP-binding protein [Eubacteriales bacterium]NLO15135.1 ABC transporter ATP-binding protein [Clostridiales bacterium]